MLVIEWRTKHNLLSLPRVTEGIDFRKVNDLIGLKSKRRVIGNRIVRHKVLVTIRVIDTSCNGPAGILLVVFEEQIPVLWIELDDLSDGGSISIDTSDRRPTDAFS